METEEPQPSMTWEEGDMCDECGKARLEVSEPENCSCHIAAPCSSCMEVHLYCPVCGFVAEAN